jgi:chitinase
MKMKQRLLAIISMGIIICAGGLLAVMPTLQKSLSVHAAEQFPDHYFAPYAEPGVGDSLQTITDQTGQKYYTLAFIISNGGCQATWGSDDANISNEIQYIHSQGGDVIISFGGASGEELAQACPDATSLQAQYQSVINQYQVKHLDFDIEGGEEGDEATYDRRNTALAALQQANPGLSISFTLPASPDGLENSSIGLLKNAVSHGVNISVVNLMTMDYDSANIEMGQAAMSAANALYSQLQLIYPSKSSSQIWSMVGITPMIGQNDPDSDGSIEDFTEDDAQNVLTFAQTNQIGELSFWAISRDNGNCPNGTDNGSSDTCSGIGQGQYDYTNIFKTFTSDNSNSSNSPTPTATFPDNGSNVSKSDQPGRGNFVNVQISAYGYPDNNNGDIANSNTSAIAYPQSEGYPTLHNQATEGTGTYDDPITFAAYTPLTEGNNAIFAPGTRIYVPYLRKYFILEDECDNCGQSPAGDAYWLHLWLGPSHLTAQDTAQSIENCENQIAQQSTAILINPSSAANYPVEQTPLYQDGKCTAKTFTVPSTFYDEITPAMTPEATPSPAPSPEASPTSVPCTDSSCSEGPGTDGTTLTVAVTSYGFPDNDDGSGHYGTAVIAYPQSDGYPTLHDEATEGSGTYDDPITFAAAIDATEGNNAKFPPGTRIYVPYLEKYFMLEDQCADCDQGTNGNAYHIDLWMGPSSPTSADSAQSIEACEGSITHDSEQIILNPTANHPVDTTPLYQNGTCSANQYGS